MTVYVRYFASLREALGPGESVQCPAGTTLEALREQLIARGGHDALGRCVAVLHAPPHLDDVPIVLRIPGRAGGDVERAQLTVHSVTQAPYYLHLTLAQTLAATPA